MKDLYGKIVELAKRRGLFWPAYEIYGGVKGFVCFGPLGSELKRRVEERWRDWFVRRQGFVEIEAPVIAPEPVFEASGHVEHFRDWMVKCLRCGRFFKADRVVEEVTGIQAADKFGVEYLKKVIKERDVRCPECGGELSAPSRALTMFETSIGPYAEAKAYGRPEAAQGMFTEFRRVYVATGERLPLGIAQVGKALRNEISPRKGVLRLREFTIMEVEVFFDPEDPGCERFKEVEGDVVRLLTADMQREGATEPVEKTLGEALSEGLIMTEWQAYFMGVAKRFLNYLGVPDERQRFREHLPDERAHYSTQTFDQEVLLSRWGWVEVSGHAYRTDYDLKAHMEHSGQDLRVFKEGRRFIPHVVEPSFGSERLMYVALEYAYREKDGRIVLSLPRDLAPISVAVLPLVERDGLPEKALEVYDMLMEEGFTVGYESKGSIGRRYARFDEIGTPVAVTVDYRTLEDDTVTLRDRDSWRQVRQSIAALPELLRKYLNYRVGFEELGEPV